MTEPKPKDQYEIRESDVQCACVELLEAGGWQVWITSQDRATRRHVKGFTDLVAVRHNVTLFIECKRPGGKLRPSQEEFRDKILPHVGPNVHWWMIDSVEKLVRALRMHALG
jgi:hypothetical protein